MKKLISISIFLIASLLISAQDWQPLSMGGADNTINSIVVDSARGVFYVGGSFSNSGVSSTNRIAVNNGVYWNNMSTGVSSIVRSMIMYDGNLHVGGNGYMYGSHGIGVWDGTSWSGVMIGSPLYAINAMEVYNGKLYVGISGTNPDPMCRVIEWDGTTATTIANFTGTNTRGIFTMEVHNGELYVGGYFTGVQSGIPATNIIKWDGTIWSNVGNNGSTNAKIFSMESYNNELYIGGSFQIIDGITTDRIIKRSSSGNWVTFGTGINASVYSMHVHNSELYVGGGFTLANGVTCNGVAKLFGNTFNPVGTGINGGMSAMGSYNSVLYAGGTFSQAGGQNCDNIASFGSVITETEEYLQDEISIYPNPSNGMIQIDGYKGNVTIYSFLGSEVYKGVSGAIDLTELKKGIYFVVTENFSKKIIIK